MKTMNTYLPIAGLTGEAAFILLVGRLGQKMLYPQEAP